MRVLDRLGPVGKSIILVPLMALCGWVVGTSASAMLTRIAGAYYRWNTAAFIDAVIISGGGLGVIIGAVWGFLWARQPGPEPEALFGSAR